MNQQISENLRRQMKTYNPQLQQQQYLLQQQLQQFQGDGDENPMIAIERLKKELMEAEEIKEYSISTIKMALQTEILNHLKIKHGINEFYTADWYTDSLEEWTKQYCILLWDEKGQVKIKNFPQSFSKNNMFLRAFKGWAKPQYWCNSGCAVCQGLFEKYDPIITPLDKSRLKALRDISEKKRQLASEIQREKALKELILAQQAQIVNTNLTKQKKK